MGKFAGFAVTVLIWPFAALWHAYALTVLWGWFIIPTFHAPSLTIGYAVGLYLVVGYLTHQISEDKNAGTLEQIVAGVIVAIIKPAFALGFGWLALKLFVGA